MPLVSLSLNTSNNEVHFAETIFFKWARELYLEAATRRCPVERVLLEFWQNSQENTCARVLF